MCCKLKKIRIIRLQTGYLLFVGTFYKSEEKIVEEITKIYLAGGCLLKLTCINQRVLQLEKINKITVNILMI